MSKINSKRNYDNVLIFASKVVLYCFIYMKIRLLQVKKLILKPGT